MTGYQSKKAAALDEDGMYLVHHTKGRTFDKFGNKVTNDEDDDTQVYKDHGDALTVAYQSGYYDGKKAAQPVGQAPCAKHCEATALQIVIKNLRNEIERMKAAQRTWVGLTDEEIDALHMAVKVRLMGTFNTKDIYRVIEDKLKEKNT